MISKGGRRAISLLLYPLYLDIISRRVSLYSRESTSHHHFHGKMLVQPFFQIGLAKNLLPTGYAASSRKFCFGLRM